MTTKTIVNCDKCGKEISIGDGGTTINIRSTKLIYKKEYDLYIKCHKKFNKWFK